MVTTETTMETVMEITIAMRCHQTSRIIGEMIAMTRMEATTMTDSHSF